MTLTVACAFSAAFSILPHSTGKERDSESGNDYFEARYYSSAMGRFMSPDWSAQEEPVPYAKLDDPQTLNLYSYAQNNPLTGVDADGHCVEDLCIGETIAAVALYTAAVTVTEGWLRSPSGQAAVERASETLNQVGDKISNVLHTEATDRGRSNEPKGLAEVGATKNTTPSTTTDPKTGKQVTTIPDGKMPDGSHVEVKDTKRVPSTPQTRAQGQASVAESGKKPTLVTGTKTKVSPSVEQTHRVVRTPKLGPQ